VNLLLLAALFAPDGQTAFNLPVEQVECRGMSPLSTGAVAPCTGILWSEAQTRDAIVCKDVTVPRLKLKFNTFERETAIRTEQYKAQLAYREQIIQDLIHNQPKPVLANYWQVASGVFAGALTATVVLLVVK